MRIVVYPHDLAMGGSQTNAIELAAAVTRLGHECIVFGRRGTLCDRVEELGLEFVESPDPGRRPSPRVARALRELVAERGIDVIHGYEWPPALEAALATEQLPDTAAVCTVMSMAVAPFIPRWMPLVVGTQQISAVEQAGGRLPVTLIEPPVDLEHNGHVDAGTVEAFREHWGLDGRPLVVVVSRLVPELKSEGIHVAIELAEALADSTPFQLLVVGDGRARAAMEESAARVNDRVGPRTVVFTGELPDPRAAYAAADVVLGMGGSALRSLAFAKPLVVQGEGGFFRRLTPDTVEEFLWQGWYGVGENSANGRDALAAELGPLLADAGLRAELGAFGREVVEGMSLKRAAEVQLTVYRDAVASRARQKRQVVAAGRSFAGFAGYHVRQRVDRVRGRRRTDDFNAVPVAAKRDPGARPPAAGGSGPILWFPGVGWDTLAGTDRQLVNEICREHEVVWVDTPHSVLRRRDRILPTVSRPHPNVVRLRAPTLAGVQRPVLREVANRRRAEAARRYLDEHGLTPRAVVSSTTGPMLDLLDGIGGARIYYATDDYVEAAHLWKVSREYLGRSRERNLRSADLVLGVTPELARHLQRDPTPPRWFPNGADIARLDAIDDVAPAEVPLPPPLAGVVGQFNARTDLALLEAVRASGTSLLLVGPRWYLDEADAAAFERLVSSPGVHWVDELPRDRLAPYLRVLDVGLTPYADSMFNRRSYPLKTLEYLAAGVPVVTTAVASRAGLDPRHVSAEVGAEAFCERVATVAHGPRDRSAIRASVAADGWAARAAQLLAWIDEGPTR